ncbi:MAG: RNA 2',3'-cyclic phosphodiesterase [Desulfatiglans sp.]|nr:RNA 2',3'-cyclic phosphodiesterase [Thermodesulfobacteriota bacterium]MEE4352612.1 RNA 2',3'-cyclic phosphodiesterase [Desulfatiglans sp.]
MDIRTFLAFELPDEIKSIVATVSGEMRHSPIDVRWVKADNIHLTVVFLGNTPSEELEAIGKTVAGVCMKYGPFKVLLSGTGIFSNRLNPRILWFALAGDLNRMAHFRNTLQKKLGPFGVKQEKRPFKPHLTVGRFRKGATANTHLKELLARYKNLTSPESTLGELVLFRSDLEPGGAQYTKLNTWALTGQG